MKKSTLLGLALGLLTAGSAFAEKDNVFGINPLAAVFGYYSGEYGRFIQDGAAEINVPFTYFSYGDAGNEISGFGLGANYRLYKDKNKTGLFYGAGLNYNNKTNSVSLLGVSDENSFHTVAGRALAGYRWIWGSGFTMAPSAEVGYLYSTYEKPAGALSLTAPAGSESGIDWTIGLGFGWNF